MVPSRFTSPSTGWGGRASTSSFRDWWVSEASIRCMGLCSSTSLGRPTSLRRRCTRCCSCICAATRGSLPRAARCWRWRRSGRRGSRLGCCPSWRFCCGKTRCGARPRSQAGRTCAWRCRLRACSPSTCPPARWTLAMAGCGRGMAGATCSRGHGSSTSASFSRCSCSCCCCARGWRAILCSWPCRRRCCCCRCTASAGAT